MGPLANQFFLHQELLLKGQNLILFFRVYSLLTLASSLKSHWGNTHNQIQTNKIYATSERGHFRALKISALLYQNIHLTSNKLLFVAMALTGYHHHFTLFHPIEKMQMKTKYSYKIIYFTLTLKLLTFLLFYLHLLPSSPSPPLLVSYSLSLSLSLSLSTSTCTTPQLTPSSSPSPLPPSSTSSSDVWHFTPCQETIGFSWTFHIWHLKGFFTFHFIIHTRALYFHFTESNYTLPHLTCLLEWF